MFPAINDYMASEVGPHTLTMTGGGIPYVNNYSNVNCRTYELISVAATSVALFAMKDKSVGKNGNDY